MAETNRFGDPIEQRATNRFGDSFEPLPAETAAAPVTMHPVTGAVLDTLGYPVDLVNAIASPAMRAVGMEPSDVPFGGSAHLRQLYTEGETPLVGVGAQAIENLPASAGQFVEDITTPITDPIGTGQAIGNLAMGTAQKLVPGEQPEEVYADAVWQFIVDRYGSWEAAKRTMAEDPVGFMADLGTVMAGGGAAAARVPGPMGQAGRAISAAGQAMDPVSMLSAAVRPLAGPAASLIGDVGTHTGRRSIEEAFRAGRAGGRQAEAFRRAIGGGPMDEVVQEAYGALENMRRNRGQIYRQGMREISNDPTVLNFDRIDNALSDAVEVKRFKGVPIGSATETTDQITEAVNRWKMLDPAEYHTPEGLDALKQQIGAIRETTAYGTPDRAVANRAYNAIKREITDQAPAYAGVMKDYWEATELINEMQRTLSLNPQAQIDTTLRKLQSLMRNNANTNYGRRMVLGEMLQEAGADTLMPTLAGQALEPWSPRGLGRLQAGAAATGGFYDPAFWAALPAQSPRIMGEMSYGAGMLGRKAADVSSMTGIPLQTIAPSMFQAGRLEEIQ